jgi:hypothetical protein
LTMEARGAVTWRAGRRIRERLRPAACEGARTRRGRAGSLKKEPAAYCRNTNAAASLLRHSMDGGGVWGGGWGV